MTVPPIRVVFCLDSFDTGGTELNAVRTAERLDRSAFDIQFACWSKRGPLAGRLERAGVRITEFPIGSLVSARALTAGRKFAKWLASERVDIVHAHDIYSNIFAVPWARVAGVRTVIASRRWWTETNRREHVWLNRLSYRLAHRVLANSESVGNLLRQEGVPDQKRLVIPNFVDDNAFDPPPGEWVEGARREFAIADDALVVGVVANLHSIKDHATLLRACALLAPSFPLLRVVLVGDGAERANLQALVSELGITERVVFAGRQPHQPSMHWIFDVSCLTSRGEGFPNSLVEALAAGRPVVATAVGGVPDAVTDGVTGFLVPSGDSGAVASALEPLLRDPQLRRTIGEAGASDARARFSADRVVGQLEATYRTLVGR